MIEITLFQKVLIYTFVLIALFIFVTLSKIQLFGIKIIKLPYRVLISILFPLIFLILILIGAFIIAIILLALIIILIFSLFGKRKIKVYFKRL